MHIYAHRTNSFLVTGRNLFVPGISLSTVLYCNRSHKNISKSSTPSLILDKRVCFGISRAHLDAAERNFIGHNSVITRATCNKESSRKCKHKQNLGEHVDTDAMILLYPLLYISLLFSTANDRLIF